MPVRVLRALLRRWHRDRDVARELQYHLDQRIVDHMASGVSREEAERRTRLEFGGTQQIKAQVHEASVLLPLEHMWADVRYAVKALEQSPAFALSAVIARADAG